MSKMANVRILSSFPFLFLAVAYLCVCTASKNELRIIHHPSSIKLSEKQEVISVGEIPKLIAASLGLLNQNDLSWNGLKVSSIFSRPKANVLITIPGFEFSSSLSFNTLAVYPLKNDIPYIDVTPLSQLIEGEFMDEKPLTVDVSLDENTVYLQTHHGDLFSSLPSSVSKMAARLANSDSILHTYNPDPLSLNDPHALALLAELQLIQDVINAVSKNGEILRHKSPDFFHFSITTLEALVDSEGTRSPRVQAAVRLVSAFIDSIKSQLVELYGGNVMIEVVTMATSGDEPKLRVARSLKQASQPIDEENIEETIGVAPDYSNDFPVIFNIILWLMIVLVIATVVIANSIWTMDPGRDSIIYRMTSQRMKKDN